MDAKAYKLFCQRPDVFAWSDLEDTLKALAGSKPAAAARLAGTQWSTPVPKPMKHRGDYDRFQVFLSADDVDDIIDTCSTLEVDAVSPEGETTPAASHYGRLVDLWYSYLNWLGDREAQIERSAGTPD